MTEARTLHGRGLADALRDARGRTLAFTLDLDDTQWRPPPRPGVNPVAWELAHIAWFAEFWVLRGPHTVDRNDRVNARRPARLAGPDSLFDSGRLAHADRWSALLPDRATLTQRLGAQLEACLSALPDSDDDDALYHHRLALFHEDMHGEAFAWLRAALGYRPAPGLVLPSGPERAPLPVPAVRTRLGAAGGPGFAFDNEAPGCVVDIAAFEIDAAPVRAGAFLAFVTAGGYDDARWWPGEAGRWRAAQQAGHPARWRRAADGQWQTRWFDRCLALDPDQPAIHLTAWEAEAFARWAGRRLPSAAEWEHAAASQPGFCWGHSVWEWTGSPFLPYPGFQPGPYRDYSAPWFGDHRELRGGAFATHDRLHDPRYRNFFQPHRHDVFAGFRTAAS